MYNRWNQNQLTRPKCHGNPKNTNKKNGGTIDTNTYTMTFNIHKIPKEIKIGYQKINVEPYIPNPLRCYKCHQGQWTQPPVCGRCGEYDIHNDCQKDYKCVNCQGNHGAGSRDCEIWKKERDYQTKTYSKYAEVTKKNIPTTKKQSCYTCEASATSKSKLVAQLVNEMRALIQEMKTVIEVVTEKLSKDLNTRVATSQERQAKPNFWGDFIHWAATDSTWKEN